MAFGKVNYFLRFLDSRLHELLSLRIAAPPWGGTFRQNGGGDVTVHGINDYSNSDVMIYANYDTCIYSSLSMTS